MTQVVAFMDLKKRQRHEIEVTESDKLQADTVVAPSPVSDGGRRPSSF